MSLWRHDAGISTMAVETLVAVFSAGNEDAAIAALTDLNSNLLLGSGRLPLAELLGATATRAAQQVSSLGDTLALRAVHNLMSLDTRVCELGVERPALLTAVCTRLTQATTAANPDTVDECLSMYVPHAPATHQLQTPVFAGTPIPHESCCVWPTAARRRDSARGWSGRFR